MTNPGLNIKDQKRRGEWAELRFMARASELGMTVTRPWGDSAHYDLIAESDGCRLRIQVKSSTCRRNNSYFCNLRGANHRYTKDDFDFLAAYIVPLDLWYVIPSDAAISGRDKLCLTPESPKNKYQSYREAWHLLKEKRCSVTANDADLCFRRGCQGRLTQGAAGTSPSAPTKLSS